MRRQKCATYKVEEAAADFVAGVRLGLQQLLHHGQEVPVDGEDLLDVGEQNLRGRAGTLGLRGKCGCSYMVLPKREEEFAERFDECF